MAPPAGRQYRADRITVAAGVGARRPLAGSRDVRPGRRVARAVAVVGARAPAARSRVAACKRGRSRAFAHAPPRTCSRTTPGRVRAALPAWPGPGDNGRRRAPSTSVISPWRASFDDRRRVRRARRRGARDASSVARRRRCSRERRPGGHRPAVGVAHVRRAAGHRRGAPGGLGDRRRSATATRSTFLRSAARPPSRRATASWTSSGSSASTPKASSSGCRSPRPTYPLRVEGVREAIAALGAEVPPLQRDEYTLEQLLDEVVGPSPQLMAIAVHKHRVHYMVDGCMAELSEVRTDCGTAQTIAVESEDPTRVVATVLALGLELQPNVSLPRELKTLAGFDAHRFAVIDVGTNSVKFHVGERRADGSWRTVDDRAEITRLGEGLDASGRLQDEPVRRTVAAIAGMGPRRRAPAARRSRRSALPGCGRRPTATCSSTRCARRCGVEVNGHLRRGGEPAGLRRGGRRGRAGRGDLVVFDTGGGSYAVHVRPRRGGRRALQRRRRRRALHGALRA